MKRLLLLIALLFLRASAACASYLVYEGFEEGAFSDGSPAKYCCDVQYSPWPIASGDCSGCTNTVTFVTGVKRSGTYGLECVFNQARAAGVKIIPDQYGLTNFGSNIYILIYASWDSSFRWYHYTKLFRLHGDMFNQVYINTNGCDSDGVGPGSWDATQSGAEYADITLFVNGSPGGSWHYVSRAMQARGENPSDWVIHAGDGWWAIELHADISTGKADLWVMRPQDSSPTKVLDQIDVCPIQIQENSGCSGTPSTYFGTLDVNWLNSTDGGSGGKMWIDELIIDNSYITPLGQSQQQPTVTVTATDASASEAGPDTGTYSISCTETTSGDCTNLSVSYSMSGTATNGTDYSTLSGSVTVPDKDTPATVTLTPLDDSTVEGDETAILSLSSGNYQIGAPSAATVTISDNDYPDPTVSLTVTDGSASETGPDTGTYRISCSEQGPGDCTGLSVSYSMSGTAVNGTDYSTLSGSVTITDKNTPADVTLTPIDDAVTESTETAILTVLDGTSYDLGSTYSGTVTIADNDAASPPDVSVSATDANAAETGPDAGTYSISCTEYAAGDCTGLAVSYSMSGTATNGTDYSSLSGTATVTDKDTPAVVTLTPIDDSSIEGDETAVLTLTSDPSYTIVSPSSATVTIADDDFPDPTVKLEIVGAEAFEENSDGGGFLVSCSESHTGDCTNLAVTYTVTGTATNGTDYTSLSGSLTIADASTSSALSIVPVDDASNEGDETVTVTLSDGASYDLGSPYSGTVTIIDNDAPLPTVSVYVTVITNTCNEDSGDYAELLIGCNEDTAGACNNLTVKYSLSGSALHLVDYDSGNDLNGQVTITDATTPAHVQIIPRNDAQPEGDETVTLTIDADAGYTLGGSTSKSITITDTDTPFTRGGSVCVE